MTVQTLIEMLQEIPDRSLPIAFETKDDLVEVINIVHCGDFVLISGEK